MAPINKPFNQKCRIISQAIQSDLGILPEKIGSGIELLRNLASSVENPIGSNLDFVGIFETRFQTGFRRNLRSDYIYILKAILLYLYHNGYITNHFDESLTNRRNQLQNFSFVFHDCR